MINLVNSSKLSSKCVIITTVLNIISQVLMTLLFGYLVVCHDLSVT